jgi:hypothetical protein
MKLNKNKTSTYCTNSIIEKLLYNIFVEMLYFIFYCTRKHLFDVFSKTALHKSRLLLLKLCDGIVTEWITTYLCKIIIVCGALIFMVFFFHGSIMLLYCRSRHVTILQQKSCYSTAAGDLLLYCSRRHVTMGSRRQKCYATAAEDIFVTLLHQKTCYPTAAEAM